MKKYTMMDILIQPLFWIVMGMFYSLMIYSARYWASDLNITMKWWKWLIAGLWFLFLSLSLAGGMTLIGEGEVHAGLYFLGLFLLISLIGGAALWRLLTATRKRSQQ